MDFFESCTVTITSRIKIKFEYSSMLNLAVSSETVPSQRCSSHASDEDYELIPKDTPSYKPVSDSPVLMHSLPYELTLEAVADEELSRVGLKGKRGHTDIHPQPIAAPFASKSILIDSSQTIQQNDHQFCEKNMKSMRDMVSGLQQTIQSERLGYQRQLKQNQQYAAVVNRLLQIDHKYCKGNAKTNINSALDRIEQKLQLGSAKYEEQLKQLLQALRESENKVSELRREITDNSTSNIENLLRDNFPPESSVSSQLAKMSQEITSLREQLQIPVAKAETDTVKECLNAMQKDTGVLTKYLENYKEDFFSQCQRTFSNSSVDPLSQLEARILSAIEAATFPEKLHQEVTEQDTGSYSTDSTAQLRSAEMANIRLQSELTSVKREKQLLEHELQRLINFHAQASHERKFEGASRKELRQCSLNIPLKKAVQASGDSQIISVYETMLLEKSMRINELEEAIFDHIEEKVELKGKDYSEAMREKYEMKISNLKVLLREARRINETLRSEYLRNEVKLNQLNSRKDNQNTGRPQNRRQTPLI